MYCNTNYTIQYSSITPRFSSLYSSSSRVADFIARYVSVISQDDYYNNAPNLFSPSYKVKRKV